MQKLSRVEEMICDSCEEDLPEDAGKPTGFVSIPRRPFDAWLSQDLYLGPIKRRAYLCPECGTQSTTLEMSEVTLGMLLNDVPGRADFLRDRTKEYEKEVSAEARRSNAKLQGKVDENVFYSSKVGTPLTGLLSPSTELADVIGPHPVGRSEALSKLWAYIKTNGLLNAMDLTLVEADQKLVKIFGKAQLTLFEVAENIGKHLSKP